MRVAARRTIAVAATAAAIGGADAKSPLDKMMAEKSAREGRRHLAAAGAHAKSELSGEKWLI